MSEQKKEAVEQALADLSDKADDCSRLAKLQRDGADKQQASADKQHENATSSKSSAPNLSKRG